MKPEFYLPKTPRGTVNFSIVRENGDRLSFAADDSCGVFNQHIRTYLQAFDSNGNDLSEEEFCITPERYLEFLADFLGYRLVRKD